MTPKFSRPRPNVIESDAGFSLEVLGRDGMRYDERGRSVSIDSEMLATKGFAIHVNSLKRWDPPDKSRISKQERDRIVNNIRRALASQDEPVHVYY
jgi:hypothetical protein